ncbi:dimethylamine corrinoid protein 2 (plasmid) [Peptoclostridium acidaminophilum DSM 3953]|uniref:Dimethylamine corrinoid protein 2 n=1 Tax=Peptoclostridium acidaminophilum DSM 3953 TaxID=1286171 RepID=W8T860_PEPAC|nr:cobalamin-dependent protein [Peptoclostridium acidaminophilum]AHM57904.1 dimethylamine corrinoid protein 2 [Peptoclostridium acidaminophilum DSM 3953]
MDILRQISDCILNMDEESIGTLIRQAIEAEHIQLQDIYEKGLNEGMVRAIDFFESKQYDIPEIIVCADTLNKGLKALSEYGSLSSESKGKILLAVVEGDTHEIGKNIVKIMLEAAGYDVVDFGVNRSVDEIISMAASEGAQIIGLSSMMTTTRGEMKKLIDKLNSMDSGKKPYIIIGGGSVTKNYSVEINADGYASNAPNTVKLVQGLLKEGK